MRKDDVFGYAHLCQFKKEGNEFPLPFQMKYLSRGALCCRHPLYSAGILFPIGAFLSGNPITVGRLLFTIVFEIFVVVGTLHEERAILKVAKK